MNKDLFKKINNLKHQIETVDISKKAKTVKEWAGVDVIIKSKLDENTIKWVGDQLCVISLQNTEPKRRTVITKYSKELSWLFYQLKDIFSERIDYISKYDFYGLLAQSAIDYLANNKDTKNSKDLLIKVLNTVKKRFTKINLPNDTSLPFFAYGIFKPGQLSFSRIRDVVERTVECTVGGALKERDGIPLLVLGKDFSTNIKGYLIYFTPGKEKDAYKRIMQIEPDKVYRWEVVKINDLSANVLVGRRYQRGSSDLEQVEEWNGKDDPFFKQGLEEVEAILKANSNFDRDYRALFRLQMAYTLLWIAIERYAGLKYHLGKEATEKVNQIAEEKAFADALKRVVKEKRFVFSTTNPEDKCTLDPDNPKHSIEYYYQVRSNTVHRGKAVTRDFDTLKSSLEELLAIFKELLNESFRE